MGNKGTNRKGFTLIIVIIGLALISILGVTIIGVTSSTFKMAKVDSRSQSAYYIAEAGINKAVDEISKKAKSLSKDQLDSDDFFLELNKFIEAEEDKLKASNQESVFKMVFEENFSDSPSFEIEIEYNESMSNYSISSIGKIGNSKRKLSTSINIKSNKSSLVHPAFDFGIYMGGGEEFKPKNNEGIKIIGDMYAKKIHIRPHVILDDNFNYNIVGNHKKVQMTDRKNNANINIVELPLVVENPDYERYKNIGTKVPLSKFKTNDREKEVKENKSLSLSPGIYGEIKLEKNSNIKMSNIDLKGDYYFEKIDADEKVKLTLDISKGPINIYSANDIKFGKNLLIEIKKNEETYTIDDNFIENNLDLAIRFAGQVYWEAHDDFELAENINFLGTILAKDEINIGKRTRLVGGVITNEGEIELESKSTIIYAPPINSAPTKGENNSDNGKIESIKIQRQFIKEM